MKFILAKKLGMTTLYESGVANNVTLLEAGKNVVTGIRSKEKDGYEALQVGMESGSLKATKKKFARICEVRLDEPVEMKVGDELKLDQFKENDKVKIIGISKGKGYQGVMKRHNFKGSPATHGHRHDHRAPGSIGSAFPERVMKGKKMAGRMGSSRVSIRNLKVSLIDQEKNIIALKGSVPGNSGTIVRIVSA